MRFARVTRSGIYVALAKRGVRPLTSLGILQHSYVKRALYGLSIPDILFFMIASALLIFILIVVIVIGIRSSKKPIDLANTNLVIPDQPQEMLPYLKKASIMTPSEQKYFWKLEQQYGQSHFIFCQVALGRIINTTDQIHFYTYWNKINKKSIDFVIVDKQSLQTVKLIELNDYTHNSAKRKQRDEYLLKVCEAAGLTIEFDKN